MVTYVRSPSLFVNQADGTIQAVLGNYISIPHNVLWRAAQAINYQGKGTFNYGQEVSDASNNTWIKFQDSVYNAILAVNPAAFSDCTIVTSGVTDLQPTSALMPGCFNPGLHKQVFIFIGDSIASLMSLENANDFFDVGVPFSTTLNPVQCAFVGSISGNILTVSQIISGVITISNVGLRIWDAQGAVSVSTFFLNQISGTTNGVGTYTLNQNQLQGTVPSRVMFGAGIPGTFYPTGHWSDSWSGPKSRVVINISRGGWYTGPAVVGNESNYATSVGGFVYNHDMFKNISVTSNQQVVLLLAIGTNDYDLDVLLNHQTPPWTNITPGIIWGSPTQGFPNIINFNGGAQGALTDLIASFKSDHPTGKVCVSTIIARNYAWPAYGSVFMNDQYSKSADYLIANRAALGIDVILDYRAFPQYASNSGNIGAITSNTTYYRDGVHPTLFGASTILNPPKRQMLDALLAGDLSGLTAPLFYH